MNINHRTKVLQRSQSGCLDRFSDELNHENFYGLEYIIDDYIRETKQNADPGQSIDWYGLSDLTID